MRRCFNLSPHLAHTHILFLFHATASQIHLPVVSSFAAHSHLISVKSANYSPLFNGGASAQRLVALIGLKLITIIMLYTHIYIIYIYVYNCLLELSLSARPVCLFLASRMMKSKRVLHYSYIIADIGTSSAAPIRSDSCSAALQVRRFAVSSQLKTGDR